MYPSDASIALSAPVLLEVACGPLILLTHQFSTIVCVSITLKMIITRTLHISYSIAREETHADTT